MKKRIVWVIIAMLAFCSTRLDAQVYAYSNFTITINNFCYLRIIPVGEIRMNLFTSVAGSPMVTQSIASTYLQMTSIAPANESRKITVIVSNGNIPPGTIFQVTALPCTTGAGTRGAPSSTITLDRVTQKDLITGIGSCYTGIMATNGYNLLYTWGVDFANSTLLKATTATTITITYTVLSV